MRRTTEIAGSVGAFHRPRIAESFTHPPQAVVDRRSEPQGFDNLPKGARRASMAHARGLG
jgi:hypothetical protein